MHRALVIVAAVGMVAFAWFADRLLLDAYTQSGAYAGGEGTREILLLADRVPRLVLLLLLGVLLLGAWRDRVGRSVATVLLLVGGLLALVPLVGIGFRVESALPLARDMFFPVHFVAWTATGLALVGLVGLMGGRERLASLPALSGWGRVAIAAGGLALTIPLDGLLDRTFLDLAASGDAALPFSALDLVTRLVVLAALGSLAILAFHGARERVTGLALVVVGLVPFIGLAIVSFVVGPSGPPSSDNGSVPVAGFAMRWLAGGIVLLGVWELTRPLPQPEPAQPARGAMAEDAA